MLGLESVGCREGLGVDVPRPEFLVEEEVEFVLPLSTLVCLAEVIEFAQGLGPDADRDAEDRFRRRRGWFLHDAWTVTLRNAMSTEKYGALPLTMRNSLLQRWL